MHAALLKGVTQATTKGETMEELSNLTESMIEMLNTSFLNSGSFAADSDNGDLYRACVSAAKAGRKTQVAELVRHFSFGYYADACRDMVNQWMAIN